MSLFPLMLRLLPADDPQLGRDIRSLMDPDGLYSVAGVRSLSKLSSLYNRYNSEHDKPYWRGPVWININYLLIKAGLGCVGHAGPGEAGFGLCSLAGGVGLGWRTPSSRRGGFEPSCQWNTPRPTQMRLPNPHPHPRRRLPRAQALRHYAHTPGPHQQQAAYAGRKLREAVLRTVVESYRSTGYFWEQYNDTTASGQGAHPFTGWTSLVALIAGEG